jgi:hypothetical protein
MAAPWRDGSPPARMLVRLDQDGERDTDVGEARFEAKRQGPLNGLGSTVPRLDELV